MLNQKVFGMVQPPRISYRTRKYYFPLIWVNLVAGSIGIMAVLEPTYCKQVLGKLPPTVLPIHLNLNWQHPATPVLDHFLAEIGSHAKLCSAFHAINTWR